MTTETFEAEVVERSKSTPVVVDFWAEWCGPCRQLGPVIEKAVAARGGKVILAKVDVDAEPQLGQVFRVQGIPAVKAFKDGRVVSEFVGAQPAPEIERFLDGLVPSEAERLAVLGAQSGDEKVLREALALEPGRADAAIPLARLLLADNRGTEASEILEKVTGSFAAEGLAARIRLAEGGDPEMTQAFSDLDAGRTEAGLDRIIAAIPDSDGAKDDLRRVVVGILEELGTGSEVARAYRSKLAQALY